MKVKDLFLLLILAAIPAVAQSKSDPVSGTWEGTSLCTVANSPCRNEHVVYHVKPDPKDATKFSIDADKIVNGEADFMGTLNCIFTAAKSELYCDTAGDWRFTITGDKMTGTLRLKDGTLYRNVAVAKK
jgi:hypothetical protein